MARHLDWREAIDQSITAYVPKLIRATSELSAIPRLRATKVPSGAPLVRFAERRVSGLDERSAEPTVHLAHCLCLHETLTTNGRKSELVDYHLAQLLFMHGHYQEALNLTKPYVSSLARRRTPAPAPIFQLVNINAKTHRNEGRYDEALDAYGQSLEHCRHYQLRGEMARQYLLVAKLWAKYLHIFGMSALFMERADQVIEGEVNPDLRLRGTMAMRKDLGAWVLLATSAEAAGTAAVEESENAYRMYEEMGAADGMTRCRAHWANALRAHAVSLPEKERAPLLAHAYKLMSRTIRELCNMPRAQRGLPTRYGQIGVIQSELSPDLRYDGLNDIDHGIALARQIRDRRAEIGNLLRKAEVLLAAGGEVQEVDELLGQAEQVAHNQGLVGLELEIRDKRMATALDVGAYDLAATMAQKNHDLHIQRLTNLHKYLIDPFYRLGEELKPAETTRLHEGLKQDYRRMLGRLDANTAAMARAIQRGADQMSTTMRALLCSSLCHEFGNALGALDTVAKQLLRVVDGVRGGERQREALKEIVAELDHVTARLEKQEDEDWRSCAMERGKEDIGAQIQAIWTERSGGYRLEFELKGDVQIECVSTLLRRALTHLLENAVDALTRARWPKTEVGAYVLQRAHSDTWEVRICNCGESGERRPGIGERTGRHRGFDLARDVLNALDVRLRYEVVSKRVGPLGPPVHVVTLSPK